MNNIKQIHQNLSHDCKLSEKGFCNFLETISQIIEEYERIQKENALDENGEIKVFPLEQINVIPNPPGTVSAPNLPQSL